MEVQKIHPIISKLLYCFSWKINALQNKQTFRSSRKTRQSLSESAEQEERGPENRELFEI